MPTSYPQASPVELVDWKKASASPYVSFTEERKAKLVELLRNEKGARILKFHQSLCPGCTEEEKWDSFLVDSVVYVKDGKVWLQKSCPEHGVFKEVYWGDWEMYRKAEGFQDPGIEIENPHMKKADVRCPMDCGLCSEHESHTGLGNIVVTNRCDLSCWYCFFYAKEGEDVYEPTMEQMKLMLKSMRDTKPVGANSIQFTGGEPTLREDLTEIVRLAREVGYEHVQLNTNGINLAKDPGLAQRLREAGVSNLYLSFDGVTPQTNPKNYWEAPKAIDSCHKAGIGVVLVPTVIGGINDHELGDIIRFGFGNIHAVRSVNFQPVSLVGKMPDKMRRQQRITIPSAIKKISEQTDGQMGKEDFFPIPCTRRVTDFVEAMKQKRKYRLSTHFACGMATYVFRDEKGSLIPLPRFFDAGGFFEYLGELADDIQKARVKKVRKAVALSKVMLNMRKYVDDKQKPKDLKFLSLLGGVMKGDFKGLEDFHKNSLFIGMMHFQDPYNWDIDRIHKCSIHYAVPDGRVLPFCTFNVIPELYRDKVQREFSVPAAEWEKRNGKKLADDKHVRNLSEQEKEDIRKHYDPFRQFKEKPRMWTDWGDEPSEEGSFTRSGKRPTMKHPAGGCGGC